MKHRYCYKIFFTTENEELKVSLTPKFHFEIECDPADNESLSRYCRLDTNVNDLCHSLKELYNDVRCVFTDETITYYS